MLSEYGGNEFMKNMSSGFQPEVENSIDDFMTFNDDDSIFDFGDDVMKKIMKSSTMNYQDNQVTSVTNNTLTSEQDYHKWRMKSDEIKMKRDNTIEQSLIIIKRKGEVDDEIDDLKTLFQRQATRLAASLQLFFEQRKIYENYQHKYNNKKKEEENLDALKNDSLKESIKLIDEYEEFDKKLHPKSYKPYSTVKKEILYALGKITKEEYDKYRREKYIKLQNEIKLYKNGGLMSHMDKLPSVQTLQQSNADINHSSTSSNHNQQLSNNHLSFSKVVNTSDKSHQGIKKKKKKRSSKKRRKFKE